MSGTDHIARPSGSPRGLVLVLHPWWGLTPPIRAACDELADHGYIAVAPDLYDGDVASTPEAAAELRSRKRRVPIWRQIVATAERVRLGTGLDRIGQIGFSMGGHWALWLAKQSRPEIPQIAATTVFYATRAGDFSASRSAFQFHLAEHDPFVSDAGIARQERQLLAAGREVEIHRYLGTGHWFFESDRPEAFDAPAAALAWARTVTFLDRHLLADP